jgi:hypothetical protein
MKNRNLYAKLQAINQRAGELMGTGLAMLREEKLTDCIIYTSDYKQIKCHKVILAFGCMYFKVRKF